MSYHLRLCKALSYKGIVSATNKYPDVFVEDKTTAQTAVVTGYFKLVDEAKQLVQKSIQQEKIQLENMKMDELKKLAANIGIDTTEFKKKTDYIEAISISKSNVHDKAKKE